MELLKPAKQFSTIGSPTVSNRAFCGTRERKWNLYKAVGGQLEILYQRQGALVLSDSNIPEIRFRQLRRHM